MKVVYSRPVRTWVMAADGVRVWVHPGQHWPADDPIVKAHPELFTDDPAMGLTYSVAPPDPAAPVAAPVEQASAAPGEKRSVRRTRGADQ